MQMQPRALKLWVYVGPTRAEIHTLALESRWTLRLEVLAKMCLPPAAPCVFRIEVAADCNLSIKLQAFAFALGQEGWAADGAERVFLKDGLASQKL